MKRQRQTQWSLAATSQASPEEEEMGKDSPPDLLEGVWPCQQLDAGLWASRTESISVALSQEACDHLHGIPSKLTKHFFFLLKNFFLKSTSILSEISLPSEIPGLLPFSEPQRCVTQISRGLPETHQVSPKRDRRLFKGRRTVSHAARCRTLAALTERTSPTIQAAPPLLLEALWSPKGVAMCQAAAVPATCRLCLCG